MKYTSQTKNNNNLKIGNDNRNNLCICISGPAGGERQLLALNKSNQDPACKERKKNMKAKLWLWRWVSNLSLRAATPGSSFPSKSSKEAPPAVLQWVTWKTQHSILNLDQILVTRANMKYFDFKFWTLGLRS